MKRFLFFLILSGSVGFSQIIPDEVAIAKAKFLKKVETAIEKSPADLNEKYAEGLEALQEKKQVAGDLESVLAIKKEVETIKTTGAIGTEEVSDASGISGMRKIYEDARRSWNNAQVDELEKLKAAYLANLKAITMDFTKDGNVDAALATRKEAGTVAAIRVSDFREKSKPASPIAGSNPSGNRAGQVRGFGRTATSKWHRDWQDLDLTPLHQYSDFVDVTGSQYHLLFRRANGDVLDRNGKQIGRNAVKLFATGSQAGYVDKEGKYYELFDGDVPAEVQPIKTLIKYNYRRLGIKKDGDVISWGGQYKSGERAVPNAAQKNIKQVAMFYDDDFALTESGDLFRWNQKKVVTMKPEISTGIEKFSISQNHGLILSKENDLYFLNGVICPFWPKKAKNVLSRQEFTAVLDMENRWHIFTQQKTPLGNEREVLTVILNRSETIDVEFYLHNSRANSKGTASYAVWIEEPGTAEIDVINTTSLPTTTTTPRKSGTGFFGTELD